MEMRKEQNGAELTIYINGSLDTVTSPDFEEVLHSSLDGIRRLVLDLTDLEYISSAGLRTVFAAHQLLRDLDGLVIRHPNEEVYKIFKITGCTKLLNFER